MDRLKLARRPLRAAVTRTFQEVDLELGKEHPNLHLLQAKRNRLDKLSDQLADLDYKIMEGFLDLDPVPTEEVQDEESKSIEDYSTKIELARISIDEVLRPRPLSPASSLHSAVQSSGTGEGTKKRSVKLPKLIQKTFNGELKEWIGFWSQFQKIHEDDSLHETDKFQYLIQAMETGTEAKDLVCSYPQSSDNYLKAITALKDRFGREDLLLQVYLRELLKVAIDNATNKQTTSLSKIHIIFQSHLRALESLNLATQPPSAWLFPLIESGLPLDTLRAWHRSPLSKQDGKGLQPHKSKLDFLMEFISCEVQSEQQIQLAQTGFQGNHLPGTQDSKSSNKKCGNQGRKEKDMKTDIPTAAGLFSGHSKASGSSCIFCDKVHDSMNCGRAQEMTLEEKNKKIKMKNACFSCLKIGHGSSKCKSFVKCLLCKKKHVTLMCPQIHDTGSKSEVVATTNTGLNCTKEVMLQTLNVVVVNNAKRKTVRVLCDPGSQKSYILDRTVNDLDLISTGKSKLCHFLFGGSSEVKSHNIFQIELQDKNNQNRKQIEVLSQVTICGTIPRMKAGPWLQELRKKKIFIQDIGEGAPEVELLIGSDHYGHIITGRKEELQNGLVALETIFGWTVSGRIDKVEGTVSGVVSMNVIDLKVSELWDLELIGIRDPIAHQSKQEKDNEVKVHFLNTVTRSSDGRYCVKLPWIHEPNTPSDNKLIAKNRLESATRKLMTEGHYDTYNKIFEGWLQEGIIEEVLEGSDGVQSKGHFLPHRPVFKPDSQTTPVRPVFDASSKSKRTPSLNECLHKGPNLLEMIPSVLLRFRYQKVGVTSDIRKAFQMIEVEEKDRNFLKFLWWEEPLKKTKILRHKRVVFGVNSSPFLLAAVLEKHCASITGPDAVVAEKFMKSLYVDNCVTSVNNMLDYDHFKETSTRILAEAKMDLRQWECGTQLKLNEPQTTVSGVLGLKWNTSEDYLSCDVQTISGPTKITKRVILSVTNQIFDPIGFTAPSLVVPKLLLQEAWRSDKSWDEELSGNFEKNFLTWMNEISYLKSIKIPRCVNPLAAAPFQLSIHTFCDASKQAYSTVIFLRAETQDGVSVKFLQAKSRIAPTYKSKRKNEAETMKNPSIPRLELLSATIGARLTDGIVKAMDWNDLKRYYWGDSTTVQAWIKRNDDWGTFVGNRVREIIQLSNPDDWRHVPGKMNPADLPSRGCSPKELSESRWWEGPEWLQQPQDEWPNCSAEFDEEEIGSEKKKVTRTLVAIQREKWYPRVLQSRYLQNIRVMGWVIRFINNARGKLPRKGNKFLEISEIRDAERVVLKAIQDQHFPNGAKDIKTVKVLKRNGLLVVNSRLLYRFDNEHFIYPIILPSKDPITEQLITFVHKTNCHAGTQFVLGKLREKYWILLGRKTVSRVIQTCVICKRYKGKPLEVEAAPLPQNRIESSSAYQTTGVDLAGPFFLKDGSKVWEVMFTCAVYRALHLDLVDSLSAEAFLRCLERFISIIGRPDVVYSDNGTNFVGSVNLMRKLNWKEILEKSEAKQIKWIFNPPTAAWWGGWWERLVRSTKELLRRMLGRAKLNFDELRTVFAAVQATINDRPLTTVTEDADDLIPLTPAMFVKPIIGSDFPEGIRIGSRELQSRYRRMQQIKQDLQARFRREYLALLVQRTSEKKPHQLKEGDVVLVGTNNKKRYEWPLGRILERIPGKDGHVRVARVKTANGILTRPIQRLYPLEIPNPNLDITPEVKQKALERKPGFAGLESISEEVKTKFGRKIKRPQRYGTWTQ